MLPNNKGAMFGVPNEFMISYKHIKPTSMSSTGKIIYSAAKNPYYPQTSYCYLTSLTHMPNEQGDTLHSDGSPVTGQLTLTFIGN